MNSFPCTDDIFDYDDAQPINGAFSGLGSALGAVGKAVGKVIAKGGAVALKVSGKTALAVGKFGAKTTFRLGKKIATRAGKQLIRASAKGAHVVAKSISKCEKRAVLAAKRTLAHHNRSRQSQNNEIEVKQRTQRHAVHSKRNSKTRRRIKNHTIQQQRKQIKRHHPHEKETSGDESEDDYHHHYEIIHHVVDAHNNDDMDDTDETDDEELSAPTNNTTVSINRQENMSLSTTETHTTNETRVDELHTLHDSIQFESRTNPSISTDFDGNDPNANQIVVHTSQNLYETFVSLHRLNHTPLFFNNMSNPVHASHFYYHPMEENFLFVDVGHTNHRNDIHPFLDQTTTVETNGDLRTLADNYTSAPSDVLTAIEYAIAVKLSPE
jgi:hypothetical protein